MRKVIFITGARRGLGVACAWKFAKEGFNIILNDYKDKERLIKNQKEIQEKYKVECMVCFGDIANEDDVRRMLNEVKKNLVL